MMFKITPHYDPYDVWALSGPGKAKLAFYRGEYWAKAVCAMIALADYLAPELLRIALGVKRNFAAHTLALAWMTSKSDNKADCINLVAEFKKLAIKTGDGIGWGLPFAWWSKNGMYPANTAYATNTPYVMECLQEMKSIPACSMEATALFDATFYFLEELKRFIDTDDYLALSYATFDEPRKVINANAYSLYAYAMHAAYGIVERRNIARDRALRLAKWVTSQQQSDGSWWYYADNEPGNFVDSFHSCFVVKNLISASRLLPEISLICTGSIVSGSAYIRSTLFDEESGLCKRFSNRNISLHDPFEWELYDQAEYLGLLVDLGLLNQAQIFQRHVKSKFFHAGDWYARIDIFHRRWGKNFLRWGIVPFQYHEARLELALQSTIGSLQNTSRQCCSDDL